MKLAKVGKDAADHIAAGHGPDGLLQLRRLSQERTNQNPTKTPRQVSSSRPATTDPQPDPEPKALWGEGDQVLWADGEALIIAALQGLRKTPLAQQIALGWMRIPGYSSLLGFPITSGMRVLYLAMDRPRQAARSFRRMVGEEHRAQLHEHLTVWPDRRPVTSPNTHPCCWNSASRRVPTR